MFLECLGGISLQGKATFKYDNNTDNSSSSYNSKGKIPLEALASLEKSLIEKIIFILKVQITECRDTDKLLNKAFMFYFGWIHKMYVV